MKNITQTSFYKWKGISPSGKKSCGIIQAKTRSYAKVDLIHQGIKPLNIRKQWLLTKIRDIDIALLFRQLGTLINAGIPLVNACSTLENSQKHFLLQFLICSIRKEIESGKNFSNQLYKFPQYFDFYICHLIRLGEQSGTLENALLRAAFYKEKIITLKNKIKQSLLYPAIITIVSIIITIIMLVFIVPRFAELFQNAHQSLPVYTQYVISLSVFIRHYYAIIIIIFIISMTLYTYLLRYSKFKNRLNSHILKLPLIGIIINKILLARFAHSLATTLAAGLTLADGLLLLESSLPNPVYKQAIQQLQRHITRGLQLHTAMQLSPLFPLLMLQMIKVGEESGKLETMLEKIAILYEQDIDSFIHNLRQLLEPLIMVILGVLIGGIVIAMYLPIFKLGTVI